MIPQSSNHATQPHDFQGPPGKPKGRLVTLTSTLDQPPSHSRQNYLLSFGSSTIRSLKTNRTDTFGPARGLQHYMIDWGWGNTELELIELSLCPEVIELPLGVGQGLHRVHDLYNGHGVTGYSQESGDALWHQESHRTRSLPRVPRSWGLSLEYWSA